MIDDRVLALMEISNDLLYGKIPREKLPYYVDESLAAGKMAASEYEGNDILELYRENGIAIHYCEKAAGLYGVVLRGQAVMGKDECRVELYRDSIRELAGHSGGGESAPLTAEDAEKIHLAHEFYHFLEYKRGRTISEQLDRVVLMKAFRLKRTAAINRCSEVAAHSFAENLLNLPFLPNLYDYYYLMDMGKLKPSDFAASVARMKSLLGSPEEANKK